MHPAIFYKYVPLKTALIVLRSAKLRWSSPLNFNDIAEFQRMPRFEPSLAEAHRSLPGAILELARGADSPLVANMSASIQLIVDMTRRLLNSGQTPEAIHQLLQQDRQDSDGRMEQVLRDFFSAENIASARVLCVTTAFDNEVMWGTYADNHGGCVLGFNHLPERSTPLLAAKPVGYSELPPVVGSGLDFLLYGNTSELRSKTLDAVCFRKKAAWSYEQEWRAVTWRPEERDKTHGDYRFCPEELESVCVGVRIPQDSLDKVASVVNLAYPQASIYRMVAEQGQLRRTPLAVR